VKKYKIKKIFGPTIQGEGSYIGKAVAFVRFAGCNRWSGREKDKEKSICKFCDTDFHGGTSMSGKEILDAVKATGCKTVILSGGEPTLQIDFFLLALLDAAKIEIHLETNGSNQLTAPMESLITHIAMSPKQSIEKTKLKRCSDIKILYPWISEDITIEKFASFTHGKMFVQPVEDDNYQENLKGAIKICTDFDISISPQLHKLIKVE